MAGLMLAALLEERGDRVGALAALRRRSYAWNPVFALMLPATLREEGRLAALGGDTAAAIHAYRHYLTLRDHPDPGAMEEEVRRVKAHLALLRAQRPTVNGSTASMEIP